MNRGVPGLPARLRTGLVVLAVLALCGLGVWRRIQVVVEYRNFAGDGWQYYRLAQNLSGDAHRFAFAPPPVPLAWSRLPGYPLLVAAVGHGAPRFNETDVALRVCRTQAFLDGGTALVAFLLAAEVGLSVAPWLAAALCVFSPLLALLCAYILSETLAVFLTTTTLWLLLRACRTRQVLHLGLAGACLGAALLCRADSVTLLPAFLVPLVGGTAPWRERGRAALCASLCALAVFAPWPVRNVVRFGQPHALGSSWVNRDGDPLPTGVQRWLSTWAVEPRAAADVAWKMTRATPLSVSALPADATDSPAERQRVGALLDAYDRAGAITAAVDQGFAQLASERIARDRLRYLVRLPLRRAREMWWNPVPDWELPATSRTLGLPEGRAQLQTLGHRTVIVAALGVLLLLLRRAGPGRALAALVLVTALARTTAVVFVVAGGTQRYLVELWPLLLCCAAVALLAPLEHALTPLLSPLAREASPPLARGRERERERERHHPPP